MATFNVISFGCRASQADAAALKGELLRAGFAEVSSHAESDVAVVNTCTVTASADAEIRQVIRRIHRSNPRCRVLVTGCYAQRAPAELAGLPGVAWVVGNSHKHAVAEILQSRVTFGAGTAAPAEMWVGEIAAEFHFAPVFADDRTRPTLKIQDGCPARCSFCIIPAVRGPSRSLPAEQVVREIRDLERQGFKEVVLSGINLGRYGADLDRSIRLLGLLEKILDETALPRVRLSSIEPMDVSPELVRLAAREPRLAEHFHVPLQSGCDRILRLMNRRYWARQYAERIRAIREALPHAAIGADVMVGFPGETGADHSASLRFIESLPFTYLHVFPYSARPGTPAAARTDPVNGRVAHERAQELREVIGRKHSKFLEAQVGRTLSVVTLDGAELPVGLSTNYLKVAIDNAAVAPNTLLDARVHGVRDGMLAGAVAAPVAARAV